MKKPIVLLLLLLGTVLSTVSWAVCQPVQEVSGTCGSATTCALTITATAAGNLGIFGSRAGATGNTMTSVSDGTSTWVVNAAEHISSTGAGSSLDVGYSLSLAAGITTVTGNYGGSTTHAVEFRELKCTGTLAYDTGGTVDNASGTNTGVSLTLAGTADYLYSLAVYNSAETSLDPTTNSGVWGFQHQVGAVNRQAVMANGIPSGTSPALAWTPNAAAANAQTMLAIKETGVNEISFVQQAPGTAVAGTTIAITMGSTPTVNNTEVAWVYMNGAGLRTVSSITQTNVTWTNVQTLVLNGESGHTGGEIWIGHVSGSPGTSITINVSGVIVDGTASVVEFSGLATSSTVDGTFTTNTATSTTPASTSYTSGNAVDLVVSCLMVSTTSPTGWVVPTTYVGTTAVTGAARYLGPLYTYTTSAAAVPAVSGTVPSNPWGVFLGGLKLASSATFTANQSAIMVQ